MVSLTEVGTQQRHESPPFGSFLGTPWTEFFAWVDPRPFPDKQALRVVSPLEPEVP